MTEFSDLEGKTLSSIHVDRGNHEDEIRFVTEDGDTYRMHHYQDCCESVDIEDINGDLDDLVGTKIVSAVEAISESDSRYGHETYTFYHLRTVKGDVTIRWHGESNGYYSERVDFEKLKGDQ